MVFCYTKAVPDPTWSKPEGVILQELADQCRWSNLGYQDGKPGTLEDIAERLETYERNTRLYIRSEQTLKERIGELEEQEPSLIEQAAWRWHAALTANDEEAVWCSEEELLSALNARVKPLAERQLPDAS